MSKSDRIKGIVRECEECMSERENREIQDGFDNGGLRTDNADSVMLDRWERDGIVHHTDRLMGIGGIGTTPHTPSPFPSTTHIDNQHIDKSLKDFNDIDQRQASSIIYHTCPSCHGTGRISMSIVNGNTVMGHGGTMLLGGAGQDIGNGIGAGKG